MFKSELILRSTILSGLILSAVTCNSIRLISINPINSVYCDNFLIYETCAEDLDNDEIVEQIYLADTLKVFLFR